MIQKTKSRLNKPGKLESRYSGPYRIVKRLDFDAYVIDEMGEEVITPEYFYVFHTYIHIQLMVILNFFLCLYAYLVERLRTWFVMMLLPAESFLLNHIARGLPP